MIRARALVALFLAAALPAACGGGEKPADGGGEAAAKPEEKAPPATAPGSGGGGMDLESLREKMAAAKGGEEPAPATGPAPAEPAPSGPEAPEPAGPEEPAAEAPKGEGEAPAEAEPAAKVPESPAEITDEEVLATWSADEREALAEMSEEERRELIEDKRIALFQSRGGVLPEAEPDPRGEARPEVVRPEDLPPPALRDILDALKSPDPEIQAGAAEAAKRFEDRAVAARHIRDLLKSPNWELRAIAAATLGDLGQESSLPALVELINAESHEGVRGKAVAALKAIGGPGGIEALRTLVKSAWEPSDRAAALAMLTETGEVKHVLDLLPEALKDLTPEVRQRAVMAVRTYDLKDYGSNLLPLLEDFSDQVIIEVLRTLGALGHRPAVGPMVGILVDPGEEAENPDSIQDAAADSLKKITGEDMGYAGTLPEEQRLAAIDNWKQWWAKNRDTWK